MIEKTRAQNRCTRLTDAEVSDLKVATGKVTIEAALQDAAEFRILHPIKKGKVN